MEINKSFWSEMTFLKVLFFWLIIPLLVALIVAKSFNAKILKDKITVTDGVFNKRNNEYPLAGVTSITIDQPFFGRIFNYGNVTVSLAGGKTVYLNGVKRPFEIKQYLESQLAKVASANHMLVN